MDKKKFEEFVNNAEKKKEKKVDWTNRLEVWQDNLNELYKNVESWLKDYIDEDKISLNYQEFEIFEEALGKYISKTLEIKIGSHIVLMKPKGTVLIGTIGRVDIIGNANDIRLIMADKNSKGVKFHSFISTNEKEEKENEEKIKALAAKKIDWVWKIASKPPRIKYTELNQETFFDCLMNVING